MFGPEGLQRIVAAARQLADPQLLSMTLEIHPVPGRTALGEDARLFRHWSNLENAEKMRYWLAVLEANARAIRSPGAVGAGSVL